MKKTTGLLLTAASYLLATGTFIASAQTELPISPIDGVRVYKRVLSLKEIRDKDVVKQTFDYSCGSSALATLMNIGFGERMGEDEVIDLILADKSQEEIAYIVQNGYSLMDLANAARAKGFTVMMRRLQIYHLYQLNGPVLIYFEPDSEKHFAVLKKMVGNYAYLADPARGNVKWPLYRFSEEWKGIVLSIDR